MSQNNVKCHKTMFNVTKLRLMSQNSIKCRKTKFMSQSNFHVATNAYVTKLLFWQKLIYDVCETYSRIAELCFQEVVWRVSFWPSHLYDNWGQMLDGFNYLRGISLEQETVLKEIQKHNLNLRFFFFVLMSTYLHLHDLPTFVRPRIIRARLYVYVLK